MNIKKDMISYIKKRRYNGGGWSGRIYLKDKRILWVDIELYSSSSVYYIDPITNTLGKQIEPHSSLESHILMWFEDIPCNEFWDYEKTQLNFRTA